MITFTDTSILQQIGGLEKVWTPAELLETCNPLPGEPLSIRNAAMKQLLPAAAEKYSELSETALRCYNFWQQLAPQRIEEKIYKYTVKISDTYQWELTVNSEGLFYKDLSPMYSPEKGKVHEQLFSDFWFYGPLMPMPDLGTRKWVVAQIRNAFIQVGPVAYQHFDLFEYPHTVIDGHWQEGDTTAQHFVNLRSFGIEYGKTTWYDGLVYIGFLSFEQFLADPKAADYHLSSEIKKAIRTHLLSNPQINVQPQETTAEITEKMKRIYMENGGMYHYIYRDYDDEYKPGPLDELTWKKELIEKYIRQLKTEENKSVLYHIATTLSYHSVPNVEELLLETAKTATPKAREAIGQVLGELFNNDKV